MALFGNIAERKKQLSLKIYEAEIRLLLPKDEYITYNFFSDNELKEYLEKSKKTVCKLTVYPKLSWATSVYRNFLKNNLRK